MPELDKSGTIWFDGVLVPWDQANVHVLTHSLHYGVAVFEGIRAYKCTDGTSAVFRLNEHIKRLFDSAHIMGIPMPYSQAQLVQACVDTLKANNMPEAYIRPIVFIGDGTMGVYPGDNPSVRVAIACWYWGAYMGPDALEKGIRVKTSTFIRPHVNATMTKAKCSASYANSVLAKVEAKKEGYAEAIMLDTEGYVSEATGANVFICRHGKIKTTPLTSVLEGITRDSLIVLARDLGYEVIEERFTRDEFYIADEAFFCGTAAEVTPICELDHRLIGAGKAGPVALGLQKEFFRLATGGNPKYESWLTRYSL